MTVRSGRCDRHHVILSAARPRLHGWLIAPTPVRLRRASAGRSGAPPTASAVDPTRRPRCSPRAATRWTSCWRSPAAIRDAGLRDAGRPGVVTYSQEGLHPADPARAGTAATTARSPPCRTGCRPPSSIATRCWRSPARAPRRAARRRCSRSATGPEERWPAARRVAGRARLRLDPRLRAGLRDRRAGGDRPAAAPQPGRAELGRAAAAQAGRAEHGHDAGDHRDPALVRAGRPALRLARQGAGGPAAGARRRRPGRRAVHHRHPDRHRRDAGRAGRLDLRDPPQSAREYGHIQEVIVQNFRAKPDTAMRGMPDAELHDLAATVAVARVLLGPGPASRRRRT